MVTLLRIFKVALNKGKPDSEQKVWGLFHFHLLYNLDKLRISPKPKFCHLQDEKMSYGITPLSFHFAKPGRCCPWEGSLGSLHSGG